MSLTMADAVVALVVLVSAFLAFNRGFVREALAIGGWIAAAFLSFYFAPMVSPLILETPYVGDFLRSSCTMTALASFVAVFGVALIVLSFFTPVLSSAIHATPLAAVDKGLGFVFGIARGVALVAVVYLLYDLVITDAERVAMIDQSASIALIGDAAKALEALAPTEVPDWLQTRIDRLMGGCVEAAA